MIEIIHFEDLGFGCSFTIVTSKSVYVCVLIMFCMYEATIHDYYLIHVIN